jgi:integrase
VVWSAAQLRTFFDRTAESDDRLALVLRFIAYVGCRISDALNVLNEDVDRDQRSVLIRRGKTPASWRTLPLIAEALADLERWDVVRQKEAPYWAEPYRRGPNRLFRRKDGRRISDRTVEDALHRLATEYGLPDCRVHDLRHAFATNGLRAGMDRRIMGRASSTIRPRRRSAKWGDSWDLRWIAAGSFAE